MNRTNEKAGGISDEERHERLDALSVGGIFVREMSEHEGFFLLKFNPKAEAQDQKSEPGLKPAIMNGLPKTHQENARINGVPHEAVRPRFYKFVSLSEGDVAAPIASQGPA